MKTETKYIRTKQLISKGMTVRQATKKTGIAQPTYYKYKKSETVTPVTDSVIEELLTNSKFKTLRPRTLSRMISEVTRG